MKGDKMANVILIVILSAIFCSPLFLMGLADYKINQKRWDR
jgi:hypothetical protein